MVKDIYPGGSSGPSGFYQRPSDGKVVFIASDGVHGQEPWITDGTAANTSLLVDVVAGSYSSSPSGFLEIGGILYFSADSGSGTSGLWSYNGTGGAKLVVDPATGNSVYPDSLTPLGSGFVYAASTVSGATYDSELWYSDGTTAGTQRVADINDHGSSAPRDLTVFGSKVLFSADDGSTGRELWIASSASGTGAASVGGGGGGGAIGPWWLLLGLLGLIGRMWRRTA